MENLKEQFGHAESLQKDETTGRDIGEMKWRRKRNVSQG
jgi:hypothetical protein